MGSRTWVTADTHFGESAAIERFGRPFADVQQMDEALLEAINRRVRKRDVLLHLGDVFGELDWADRAVRRGARTFLDRIRCRTVVLVRGNQDPGSRSFARRFAQVHDLLDLRVDDPHEAGRRLRVVCCHYPLRQWRGTWTGAMHLHGHSHGSLPEHGRGTDAGVDCWSYAPMPLDELVAMLARRPAPQGEFRRLQPMRPADAQPPL
jgi:calcineurin-like phosphoesterase family protein